VAGEEPLLQVFCRGKAGDLLATRVTAQPST
jgi:hypothetical protein